MQGILRFYTLEENKTKIKNEINIMVLKSFIVSSLILIALFIYAKADVVLIIIAVSSLFFSLFYTTRLTIEQALLKSKNYILADITWSLSYFAIPLLIYYFL